MDNVRAAKELMDTMLIMQKQYLGYLKQQSAVSYQPETEVRSKKKGVGSPPGLLPTPYSLLLPFG